MRSLAISLCSAVLRHLLNCDSIAIILLTDVSVILLVAQNHVAATDK
jgi:hypothetical protein